jgi:hypothetical protein
MKKTTSVKKVSKTPKSKGVKLTSHMDGLESYTKTTKPRKIQFPFEVKFFVGTSSDYMVFKFGTGRDTSFGVFIPTYTTDSGKDVDSELYEKINNPVKFWKEIWDSEEYYSKVKQRKPRVKRPHGSTKPKTKRKVS